MADRAAVKTAAPIPWAGDRTVPLRVLTLHLRPTPLTRFVSPAVLVDGRQYVVAWGWVTLEVPADRPVHIAAVVLHRRPLGAASLVLEPEDRPVLEYSAPAQLIRIGELGSTGATRHRGRGLLGCLVVGVLLVVLTFLALVVALVVATG